MMQVAVIGAGVTGMAAAWWLNRAGCEVTIFDADDRAGGRIGSTRFSGRTLDTGPDALGPDLAMDDLLAELGLAAQVEHPDPPRAFWLTTNGTLEPFGVGGGTMFGLADGIQSLTGRLEEALREAGVGFRLGLRVEALGEEDDRVVLRFGETASFDHAVVAVGASAAASLLGGSAAEALNGIRSRSVTLVHLTFPSSRIGRERNGTGYLVSPDDERLLTGCTWSSAKWKRLAGEPEILRASFLESGQGQVIGLSDQEIVEMAMTELAPVMELEGDPVDVLVSRYPTALVIRDDDHAKSVESAREALGRHSRIKLVGADLDGPGISRSVGGVRETVKAIIEGNRND